MYRCVYCDVRSGSNQELLIHIKLIHGNEKIFKCAESHCLRTYSIYRSFKRHRLVYHSRKKKKKCNATLAENKSVNNCNLNVESHIIQEELIGIIRSPSIGSSSQNYFSSEKENVEQSFSSSFVSNNIVEDENTFDHIINQLTSMESNSFADIKAFKAKLLLFIGQLYNFQEISRSKINDIIASVFSLLKFIFNCLDDSITKYSESKNSGHDIINSLKNTLQGFQSNFDKLGTETLRFKKFRNSNTFIEPEEIIIGEREEFTQKDGVKIYKHLPVSLQYISLSKTLKSFFELPHIFSNTINYVSKLENSSLVISNYIQGSLWQERKQEFKGKIVLPLFLYYDDYEPNNALGSHRGISKIGAVYASIPCLPPELQSKIENIF